MTTTIEVYEQLLLLLHPFNGLFSRTTWVSGYRKGKTSLDFNEARDDRVWGPYAKNLNMQQTDKHINTSSQCQSTKGLPITNNNTHTYTYTSV